MVFDKVIRQQVGRLYPSASEARIRYPSPGRYEITTVDQFCMASDWCPKPAVTIADLPGYQEAVTHHVPVCADFVKSGVCKAEARS